MQISKRRKLAVGTIVFLGLLTFIGTGFLAWRLSSNETLDAGDASADEICYENESNSSKVKDAVLLGRFCMPSDIRGVIPGGKDPGTELNYSEYYYFDTPKTKQVEIALEYPADQDLLLMLYRIVRTSTNEIDLKTIGFSNEVGAVERLSSFIPKGEYLIRVYNDKGATFGQRESYRLKSELRDTSHTAMATDQMDNSQLPYCNGANVYINGVAKGSNKTSLKEESTIRANSLDDKMYFKVATLDRTSVISQKPRQVQLCFSVADMPESYYRNYYDGGVSVFSCEYVTPVEESVAYGYKEGGNTVWKAQTKEMTYAEHAKKLLNIPGVKNGGRDLNVVPALTEQEILDKGFIYIMNVFDNKTQNICSSNQSFNQGTGTIFEGARGKTTQSNCMTYGSIDTPSYCNAKVGFEAFNEVHSN